jgi:hypothetical protein
VGGRGAGAGPPRHAQRRGAREAGPGGGLMPRGLHGRAGGRQHRNSGHALAWAGHNTAWHRALDTQGLSKGCRRAGQGAGRGQRSGRLLPNPVTNGTRASARRGTVARGACAAGRTRARRCHTGRAHHCMRRAHQPLGLRRVARLLSSVYSRAKPRKPSWGSHATPLSDAVVKMGWGKRGGLGGRAGAPGEKVEAPSRRGPQQEPARTRFRGPARASPPKQPPAPRPPALQPPHLQERHVHDDEDGGQRDEHAKQGDRVVEDAVAEDRHLPRLALRGGTGCGVFGPRGGARCEVGSSGGSTCGDKVEPCGRGRLV